MFKWLLNRWKEPDTKVAIVGIVAGIGSYFGLDLTPEQNLAVVTVIGVIIGAVAGATKRAGSEDA